MSTFEGNIDKITSLVREAKKITVFTGAGVSTSCGIPDFRGKNGLYSIAEKKYKLPYPEAIFDIQYFINNPAPFYAFSKELLDLDIQPSVAHKFIAWLEEQQKISIIVTQNIDMLHEKAGSKQVVACHGSYTSSHCLQCGKEFDFPYTETVIKSGEIPYCDCGGLIKPDVVFFGEQLPESFYRVYWNTPVSDLLLVLGTSLSVQPAAGFALKQTEKIRSIIVNSEPTDFDDRFTCIVYDDIDRVCAAVWNRLTNA